VPKITEKVIRRFDENFSDIEFCRLQSLGDQDESSRSLAQIWKWIHSKNDN